MAAAAKRVTDVMAVADRLRPTVLQLARELRREKIAGVSPHQVGLMVSIKYAPGVTVGELASEERVSTAAMSKRISRLERDGLVTRTMFPTIPPRVDYELTQLGRNLMVPLRSLYDWAVKHRPAMLAARKKFAEKERLAVGQRRFTTPK